MRSSVLLEIPANQYQRSLPKPVIEEADKVLSIWRRIYNYIINLFIAILQCFIPVLPTKYVVHKLNEKARSHKDNLVTKLYYKEVANAAKKYLKPSSLEVFFKQLDNFNTESKGLLDATKEKISIFKNKLPKDKDEDSWQALLDEADDIYLTTLLHYTSLKKISTVTEIQTTLLAGQLTTLFRELDDALSDYKGEMLHRYCGCHIESSHSNKKLREKAPTLQANLEKGNYEKFVTTQPINQKESNMPSHPSAVCLSQSFGGGHNVVQEAISHRFAKHNGHTYKIEADERVLEPFFQFKKWTGKTGAEWSKFFLQGRYFRTIRLLGYLSSGDKRPASTEQLAHKFALAMLSTGRQDLAMMFFTRQAKAAEEAADYLGMGMTDFATDLDYEVFGFGKGSKNPFYRHVLMAKDEEFEAQGVGRVLKAHQIVEGGFPVRYPFLKKYNEKELADIRSTYREKFQLEDDARVVVLLCGGEGVQSKSAEILARKYSQNGPKIHLFVVCGNNQKYKEKLNTFFQDMVSKDKVRKDNFKGTALGWMTADELGELFAMATFEKNNGLLISAKAGGGTVSEAIARGIPLLISDRTKMIKHEGMNLKFIEKKKLGKTFSHAVELPKQVEEMLSSNVDSQVDPKEITYSNFDSENKSMEIVANLIRECREDRFFQEKQVRSFASLPLLSPLL